MKIIIDEKAGKRIFDVMSSNYSCIINKESSRHIRFQLIDLKSWMKEDLTSLILDTVVWDSDCWNWMREIDPTATEEGDVSVDFEYSSLTIDELIEVVERYKFEIIKKIDEWELTI